MHHLCLLKKGKGEGGTHHIYRPHGVRMLPPTRSCVHSKEPALAHNHGDCAGVHCLRISTHVREHKCTNFGLTFLIKKGGRRKRNLKLSDQMAGRRRAATTPTTCGRGRFRPHYSSRRGSTDVTACSDEPTAVQHLLYSPRTV